MCKVEVVWNVRYTASELSEEKNVSMPYQSTSDYKNSDVTRPWRVGGCNFRQSGIPTELVEIPTNMCVFYQKFRQQRRFFNKIPTIRSNFCQKSDKSDGHFQKWGGATPPHTPLWWRHWLKTIQEDQMVEKLDFWSNRHPKWPPWTPGDPLWVISSTLNSLVRWVETFSNITSWSAAQMKGLKTIQDNQMAEKWDFWSNRPPKCPFWPPADPLWAFESI